MFGRTRRGVTRILDRRTLIGPEPQTEAQAEAQAEAEAHEAEDQAHAAAVAAAEAQAQAQAEAEDENRRQVLAQALGSEDVTADDLEDFHYDTASQDSNDSEQPPEPDPDDWRVSAFSMPTLQGRNVVLLEAYTAHDAGYTRRQVNQAAANSATRYLNRYHNQIRHRRVRIAPAPAPPAPPPPLHPDDATF